MQENKISYLEDIVIKISQTETKREKVKKKSSNISELWDNMWCFNMSEIRVPERGLKQDNKERGKHFFNKIMDKI